MPPDVFLMLSSSGLALIASLLFLVKDEPAPSEPLDGPLETYALPPLRPPRPSPAGFRQPRAQPPSGCRVQLDPRWSVVVEPSEEAGGDWGWFVESTPGCDEPARLWVPRDGAMEFARPHDLRWVGKAGVVTPAARRARLRPGRA